MSLQGVTSVSRGLLKWGQMEFGSQYKTAVVKEIIQKAKLSIYRATYVPMVMRSGFWTKEQDCGCKLWKWICYIGEVGSLFKLMRGTCPSGWSLIYLVESLLLLLESSQLRWLMMALFFSWEVFQEHPSDRSLWITLKICCTMCWPDWSVL